MLLPGTNGKINSNNSRSVYRVAKCIEVDGRILENLFSIVTNLSLKREIQNQIKQAVSSFSFFATVDNACVLVDSNSSVSLTRAWGSIVVKALRY
jgi:hypothetical protein